MSKVNILGTEYDFTEDLKDDSCDGMTDVYAKTMQIKPKDKFFEGEHDDKADDARRDEVIIHEICHAFFFESGLSDYCYDETLVGWLGKQIPKIITAVNTVV